MKSFIKETGKAIAYFAIYLLMQVVATIGVSFLFEFKLGYEAGASGKTDMENFQEIAAKAGEMTMHNMGLVLIINAILAIAIYVIIAKCRNKSFMGRPRCQDRRENSPTVFHNCGWCEGRGSAPDSRK